MICVNCTPCPNCNGEGCVLIDCESYMGAVVCPTCRGREVICGENCLAPDVAESTDNEENV